MKFIPIELSKELKEYIEKQTYYREQIYKMFIESGGIPKNHS